MANLLLKYKPTSLKQVIGNKILIRDVTNAITNKLVQVLIVGPSGCGKTLVCDIVLQNQNVFDVLHIKGENNEDAKSLKSLLDNFVSNRTIESFMSKKKKLVFFDDIDVLLACDRNINSFLTGFIDNAIKSATTSFIMTSSDDKKLTELKKKVSCIRVSNPTPKDTFAYVSNILDDEGTDYDPVKLLKLIQTHNGNVRSVLNNLHQMDMDEDAIMKEKQSRFMFDSNIFDITKKLLKRKVSLEEIMMVSDNNLIPLLVYENFTGELSRCKTKQNNTTYIKTLRRIIDMYLAADCMEQYMYQHTQWGLFNNITILKCGSINIELNNYPDKKRVGTDDYVFTHVLTKAALRCNYSKKLKNVSYNVGISSIEPLYLLFDSFADEMIMNEKKFKDFRKFLHESLLTEEAVATLYQYFSQFLTVDKKLLAKLKKT